MDTPFFCVSDTTYENNPVTRWSTAGLVFLLLGEPIDWKVTKQCTVTMLTIEAELLALSNASKNLYSWWCFLSPYLLSLISTRQSAATMPRLSTLSQNRHQNL